MNRHTSTLLALLATTWIASTASAQFYPLPPPAYPGLFNTTMRSSDPYMSSWDIGVNIRGRMEDKDNAGFTSAGQNRDFAGGRPVGGNGDRFDNNNTYFTSRIMPRIGYTDKWFQAFIQLRSSTSYDDERGNNGTTYSNVLPNAAGIKAGNGLQENDNDINLQQAYVFVGNHKEFPLSAKIGRQELVYGEQRQVGAFAWNNNGRSFDVVKTRYQSKWFGVDVFTGGVVYNDNHNFNESHLNNDHFSGIYVNFTKIPGVTDKQIVETYLYNHNVDRDSTTENWNGVAAPFRQPFVQDLYTAGLRIKSKPGAYGPWDYSAELMYQFGTINNRTIAGAAIVPVNSAATIASAKELEQQAYAAILQAGYTWTDSPYQPRLALIYSYGSGDKNAADGKSGTFQNQYATTHMFYGYMDLNSLQNLSDLRLAYTIKPTTKITMALEGHLQYLDSTSDYWYNVGGVPRTGGAVIGNHNGYNRNSSYSNQLGQEIDFITSYSPVPYLNFEAGLCHFFRGDYVKQSFSGAPGDSKDASYAYIQATLNL